MKIPPQYAPHLDHRITALMAFTVRRESGWFDQGQHLGDVYRCSLEGAGIMLRMLMEFLGVKADAKDPTKLGRVKDSRNEHLGMGLLTTIAPVDPSKLDRGTEQFLAKMHSEASKRTAHPGFIKFCYGLDPQDLREATKWVLSEIWTRCYDPDPITVHPDLYSLLHKGQWESIPFQPAK